LRLGVEILTQRRKAAKFYFITFCYKNGAFMTKTHRFAMGFFVLIGLMELGDLWGNITTIFDAAARQQSMDILGVSETAQYARLALLIPLTLVSALSCFRTVWGIYRHEPLARRGGLVAAGGLSGYALFILATAMIAASMNSAFVMIAIVYGLLAGLAFYLSGKIG
jgi:hypothetical protein